MPARKGSHANPFELRPGETDTFYFVFRAAQGLLAPTDTISGTPSVTGVGATVANVQKNGQALELDGVTHAIDTVVLCDVSAIALGDLAELECTISTTAGRGPLKQSMFVKGVQNYS